MLAKNHRETVTVKRAIRVLSFKFGNYAVQSTTEIKMHGISIPLQTKGYGMFWINRADLISAIRAIKAI